MDRGAAVERVRQAVDTIEHDPLPVPVREVWVSGDIALGLDPVERIDLYLRKDLLFASEDRETGPHDPDRATDFADAHGIDGVGKSVSAAWAAEFPEHLVANDQGYAAPADCLANHLIEAEEPIHLEICNAGFEQNVVRRAEVAADREAYDQVLDPRAVCLWQDGTRSDTALSRLAGGEFAFPPLPEALEAIGLPPAAAEQAAESIHARRQEAAGPSVRADVI